MGAGALGSVFGGLLAEHGHDVTFVGADDHLLAMQRQGLTVTGIWGDHHIGAVKAHYGTESLTGRFDIVLLSVKSYHTAAVVAQTLPFIHDESLVFSIQNGLGNWETIAKTVGWDRTVGARVIFGAEVEKPGTARVTVYADKVLLGSPSARCTGIGFNRSATISTRPAYPRPCAMRSRHSCGARCFTTARSTPWAPY